MQTWNRYLYKWNLSQVLVAKNLGRKPVFTIR